MANVQKVFAALLKCLAFVLAVTFSASARADDKDITDGACENMALQDIPVGDFTAPVTAPQSPLNINQKYYTSYDEGYWASEVWMYGHDGLDTEGESDEKGVNDVFAILPGVAVLSKAGTLTGGWGESIIIATRVNPYSEEILTHHYHHLHAAGMGQDYTTTRQFNACDGASAGDVVGKEGSTGKSGGSHLHLSVRRWQNLTELASAVASGGHALFGYGYAFGDDAKLARNLDPQGLIFNTFRDYQWEEGFEPQYSWSLPYVLKMRSHGVEFGLFDGRFGADTQVKKRESARWLKIAAKLPSYVPQSATWSDLPLDDPDSAYIERLVRFPEEHPVFDPSHTCQNDTQKFCPDAAVNRAEALKTVIMAFYGDEFIRDYDHNIWAQSYELAIQLLDIFTDVPVLAWYAPYVYFGVTHGLVTQQDLFAPEEPVRRQQMAKWVITGIEHLEGMANVPCEGNPCPAGYYCSSPEEVCAQVPECVPSEGWNCEVGGGYDPCENGAQCQPGQTKNQSCAVNSQSGLQTSTCTNECQWGGWEQCVVAANCPAGTTPCQSDCCDNVSEACFEGAFCVCANPYLDCGDGICKNKLTDNENCGGCGNICSESKTCTGGFCVPNQNCSCSSGVCCDGCNYRLASEVCDQWYVYHCQGPDPGQNSEQALIRKYCSGSGSGCNGVAAQFGWQTLEDCSEAQVCQMNNGIPECVGACQDQYLADSASACYGNPQGAGTPTLCLEVQQISGPSFKYRACKQGGTFGNQFTHQLKDNNNSVNFSSYNGSAGITCTDWRNFDVGYISGYGSLNGAGVQAEIISPQGCIQSSCKYRTGTVTITKTCL